EKFIEYFEEPKRFRYAKGDDDRYYHADPGEYLTPVELEAFKRIKAGRKAVWLSNCLEYYWRTHKRTGDEAFVAKVTREWDRFVSVIGDLIVTDLTRAHAHQYVDHCLSLGHKTGTVRRSLNQICAVLNVVIREAELNKQNPFADLPIPGEGTDAKDPTVPTTNDLQEVAKALTADDSPVALMALIQMELGSRIGEVSG